MSVCQVEQYYIHLKVDGLDSKKEEIKSVLLKNNCMNYDFQGDDNLVVEDFECEFDAGKVEQLIMGALD